MPGLTRLHHAALSVSDLDASVGWYGRVLQLEETFRQESYSRRVAVLRHPGASDTLGLVQHVGSGGTAFDVGNLGLDHLAFGVGSGEELEAWASHLEDLDVASSGVVPTPFGGMLHFKDRDGIALALFWERAEGSGPQP